MSELIFTTPPDSTDSAMLHLQRQTVSLDRLASRPVTGRFFASGGAILAFGIDSADGGSGYLAGETVMVGASVNAIFTVEEVDENGRIISLEMVAPGQGFIAAGTSYYAIQDGNGAGAQLGVFAATEIKNEIVTGHCRNFMAVLFQADEQPAVEATIEGAIQIGEEEIWVPIDVRTIDQTKTLVEFTGAFSKIRASYAEMAGGHNLGYLTAY